MYVMNQRSEVMIHNPKLKFMDQCKEEHAAGHDSHRDIVPFMAPRGHREFKGRGSAEDASGSRDVSSNPSKE